MALDFDLGSIDIVEFATVIDEAGLPTMEKVVVDESVQASLSSMVMATWNTLDRKGNHKRYEVSGNHEAEEYAILPIADELCMTAKTFYEAQDPPVMRDPNNRLPEIDLYFAKLKDRDGRRITAVRRPSVFKGLLKKQNRLLRHGTNSLRFVEERIFQLDSDFDVLIDSQNVHILRPKQFEFAFGLQEVITNRAPQNIRHLQERISFVDFSPMAAFADKHTRAARYLDSIRTSGYSENIDLDLLVLGCGNENITLEKIDGGWTVAPEHYMDFLEMLDRRRLGTELVRGRHERFRADMRTSLDNL